MSKHEEVAFLVDFIEGLGFQTICIREVVNLHGDTCLSQGGTLQSGWHERSKVRVIDSRFPALATIDRHVRIIGDMIVVSNTTRRKGEHGKEFSVLNVPMGEPDSLDKLEEVLMSAKVRWL